VLESKKENCAESNIAIKAIAFVVDSERVASVVQLLVEATLLYIIKLIKKKVFNYLKLFVINKNITLRLKYYWRTH